MLTFPLFPIGPDGRCTCSNPKCPNAGKHPQVTGWRHGHPVEDGEPYGIVTGPESGIFVVDLDEKPHRDPPVSGFASLQALAAQYGTMPATTTVRTGGGGLQLYFKWPSNRSIRNSVQKLAPGVDVRGEGGFVVAPGSPHRSGKLYEAIIDEPPVDAPAWLLDLIERPALRATASADAPVPIDVESEEGKSRVQRYRAELATRRASIQGENGSGALWEVAQLGVRTYALPAAVVVELIREVFNPRCEPEWSEEEIWHKVEDARDSGTWPCGTVYSSKWETFVDNVAKPAVLKNLLVPAPAVDSQYTFSPGDRPSSEQKKANLSDLTLLLCHGPGWAGVWRKDIFADRIVAHRPPCKLSAETRGFQKIDVAAVQNWLECNEMKASIENIENAIKLAAHQNEWHPVREYLDGLPSVQPRGLLEEVATECLGSKEPRAAEYMAKFLIGAVRRIYQPGIKMQTMIVLIGKMSMRKSTFGEDLFSPAWFTDSLHKDLTDAAAITGLRGKWCVEVSELASFRKNEIETVRAFISRSTDHWTPKYENQAIDVDRQCVFLGTTNDDMPLKDPAGARRFWPIKVTDRMDRDWLATNRDAIWAEAKARAATSELHYFEDDLALEDEKDEFKERDAWHDLVKEYCAGKEWVRVDDVWKHLGGELQQFDNGKSSRIIRVLTELKCEQGRRREKGMQIRVWTVPAELRDLKPAKREVAEFAKKVAELK